MVLTKSRVPFVLSVILLVLTCGSIHATAVTCSKATLKGSYGSVLAGFAGGVPVDSGGLLILDGKGTLHGNWTTNANGTVQANVPVKGTYSVVSNCTGKLALVFSTGTAHFNTVVDNSGRFDWIETDNGTTESGYALPVGTKPCSEAEIKGTWSSLEVNGFVSGIGPGAAIGPTTFNGTGGATITGGTASVNGVITTAVTGKGTYTVNPDCTGTVTMTLTKQDATVTGLIIIVNDGQEIMGVGTTLVNIQAILPVK
jgi:hypothetical protein